MIPEGRPGPGGPHLPVRAAGVPAPPPARRLSASHAYQLGSDIPAYATVTCFCRPLRPDSVRGTYTMATRGIRQLAGRIDAVLYFTAWDNSGVHATYRLKQRIHGVRP